MLLPRYCKSYSLGDYRKDFTKVQYSTNSSGDKVFGFNVGIACALSESPKLGCIWLRGQSNERHYFDAFVGSEPLDDYRKDCARVHYTFNTQRVHRLIRYSVQCWSRVRATVNESSKLGCIWLRGQSNEHHYFDTFEGLEPLDDYRKDCTRVHYTLNTQRVHRLIRYSVQCWYRMRATVNESPKLGCICPRGQCNERRYFDAFVDSDDSVDRVFDYRTRKRMLNDLRLDKCQK